MLQCYPLDGQWVDSIKRWTVTGIEVCPMSPDRRTWMDMNGQNKKIDRNEHEKLPMLSDGWTWVVRIYG